MKFKLFGRLTKKKAVPGGQAQSERQDPHVVINELTAKGLAESEIIRTLKDEGYSFKEIDDALNESVRNEVTGAPSAMAGPPPGEVFAAGQDMGGAPVPSQQEQYQNQDLAMIDQQDADFSQKQQAFTDSTNITPVGGPPRPGGISMPEEGGAGQQQQDVDDSEREKIYEIVESVVNERVNSLRSEMKEIGAQIKGIQQIIGELKSDVQEKEDARRKEMGSAHESIKENATKIIDMEPRVAGLERAFKDIVPNLVDSVREVKELVAGNVDGGHGHDVFDAPEKKDEHEDVFGEVIESKDHESVPAHAEVSDTLIEKTDKKKEKGHDGSHKEENIFDESDDDERI